MLYNLNIQHFCQSYVNKAGKESSYDVLNIKFPKRGKYKYIEKQECVHTNIHLDLMYTCK